MQKAAIHALGLLLEKTQALKMRAVVEMPLVVDQQLFSVANQSARCFAACAYTSSKSCVISDRLTPTSNSSRQ